MNPKAFSLGILSSLFFSATFILNRSMSLGGGSWMWSAALRFLIMLPILLAVVGGQKKLGDVHRAIRHRPLPWFVWSCVGFVGFYFFLSLGADHGNSWLVAGTWQITVVAGALMTPLFKKKIPVRNLLIAAVILVGVFLLEMEHVRSVSVNEMLHCLLPIVVAAFAYPLGNRKLMAMNEGLTTTQRVYGMTLCSYPLWLLIAGAAWVSAGPPSKEQLIQGALVAVLSGVLATLLFFRATDMTKDDPRALAITESTAAGEVVFTLLGGIILLNDPLPGVAGWVGLVIIVVGLALNR